MRLLNLEPSKHIALHHIHKLMLFLATSYDPFNIMKNSIKEDYYATFLNI